MWSRLVLYGAGLCCAVTILVLTRHSPSRARGGDASRDARDELQALSMAAALYCDRFGALPGGTPQDVCIQLGPILEERSLADARRIQGGLFVDPWGRPVLPTFSLDASGAGTAKFLSIGADGVANSADDVVVELPVYAPETSNRK